MVLSRLATIGLPIDCSFTKSNIDACVFFGKGCIVLTHVDDCIIVRDKMDRIESLITSLHDGKEIFVLKDKGSIDKYLGVSIMQLANASFELTQPFLIERISIFLGIANGRTNECTNSSWQTSSQQRFEWSS
jgi:hypothetical protein